MLEKYVQQLASGDKQALCEIYILTSKAVFATCLSIVKNYSIAQDLMQDTYIKVQEKINSYKLNSNAFGWIIVVARNLCLNYIARAKFEVAIDENFEIASNEILRAKDESGIISLAVKVLNDNERQIVFLHTLGDIKLIEIAKILAVNSATIRWQYNNALTKLRKEIEKGGLL